MLSTRIFDRIAKKLLTELLPKNVKGFCSELNETCSLLNVSLESYVGEPDVRKKLKDKLVEIQAIELFQRMALSSKMDKVLLSGFKYDGSAKKYLMELDFVHARAVFMVRYRMLPTKCNFPGRWKGEGCNVCGFEDSDSHIFTCPGYADLVCDDVWYSMFWDEKILNDSVKLRKAAVVVISLIERLETVQEMI